MNMKSYKELNKLKTHEERFEYLNLNGSYFESEITSYRDYNQKLYKSAAWKRVRRDVILRDCGCNMGLNNHPITGKIYVHHINPIKTNDIIQADPKVLDDNNLICVDKKTHDAIHYGDYTHIRPKEYIPRKKGDQCPWK